MAVRDHAPAQMLWELTADLFCVCDLDGRIEAVNPSCARVLGAAEDELVGRSIGELIGGRGAQPANSLLGDAAAGVHDEFETCLETGDGSEHVVAWSARRVDDHVYLVGRDMTAHHAGHPGFERQLHTERTLRGARDYLRAVTENLADGLFTLDSVGRVTMMNPAAERMLGWSVEQLVGRPLHAAVHSHRRDDGSFDEGDCPILSSLEHGQTLQVDDDVFWRRDGTVLPVAYSVAPFTTEDGEQGRIVLFSDIRAAKAREQRLRRDVEALDWVSRIREALAHESFVLYAQPIADAATGTVARHELLLRMLDEVGALVPPARFLKHAERYGLIRDIDRWVIRRAARVAAAGHRVQLNLSADSLADPELFAYILEEIRYAGAAPADLIFEITETALLRNEEAAHDLVISLKALGCGIALDDFGTGYGGFTYLKTLPVDYLKIDVEFVRDLAHNPASEHVVSAIVNLARGFGQQTIAEGVEDAAALARLREMGVHEVQGFAVGPPSRVDEEWFATTEVVVQ